MDFLIIDDDKTFREATCFLIDEEGHYAEGAASGQLGLKRLKEERFDAVLLDLNLGPENGLEILTEIQKLYPELPVVMIAATGNIKTAVEAMRRGAADFLEKPFGSEQFLTVLARLQRLRQMGQRIERLEREVTERRAQEAESIFDFTAPAMQAVMETLLRAAKTPASILIFGESGTGKSVIARAMHQNSHLADKPFITVSCPSLSKELLESDLFGHVRGAFTGAVKDHWGKVSAAEGGTLFLDEIGDLPLEIQPKLLRLLQEREYERLGENVTRLANVRVLAATNRDLKSRVAEGIFREDLYFRLNVITVEIPPLRSRPADLRRFADHYAKHFAARCGRKLEGFTEEALASICGYAWPGNLRELRNAIERAVILGRESQITPRDLPAELQPQLAPGAIGGTPSKNDGLITLEQLEEQHVRRVLAETRTVAEAAQILGVDQATVYRRIRKFGLEKNGGRAVPTTGAPSL
jgi:NtrC-family two-component system response regulator AlgB